MTCPKCENCCCTGHIAAKCWAKGSGQEGQYPEQHKGNRDTHTSDKDKAAMGTPIVWSYGYASQPYVWFADSAETKHVSPKQEDFTSYQEYNECQIIKALDITQSRQ